MVSLKLKLKTTAVAVGYAGAMLSANLLVAAFGPAVTPINAFVLIGFDLTARDYLHERIRWPYMAGLIFGTSCLSYAISPDTKAIAVASAVSFLLASAADWWVYAKARGTSWLRRSNRSNAAGAAVDSVVFPALAFGAFMPEIMLLQFLAKTGGGFAWSLVIQLLRGRHA